MSEHKIILGGEQHLPFARSQLKALRAAGQLYASRRWVMPDGATVSVRTRGEIDYIQLEGGAGGLLAMDSGLVDLKHVEEGSPLRHANATRIDTASTTDYLVGYHLPIPAKPPWVNWLAYPEAAPHGQFIGTVQTPNFAGHIRADLTRCAAFEARRVPVTPATDPATWAYATDDDVLWQRKYMVAKCPASVFTGRTRLYVQAMYGRHLYEYGGETATKPKETTTAFPALASQSPPSLSLPAFHRNDDEQTYAPVVINTSTGLRFDAATGRHWLMIINGATLAVYPLRTTPAGEKLRKYLAGTPTSNGSVLTTDDREKLEAYLLAYSLPDVKNSFSIDLTGPDVSAFHMGYGWHWNWSGTAADIINTTTFEQEMYLLYHQFAQESTHYRLSVGVGSDGSWTGAKTVVEGPSRWAVNRGYWCIAEPVWGGMATKSTPKRSKLFACDAPFYVFYARDDLRVCRVIVTEVPAVPRVRTHSYGFADDAWGGAISELTAGMLDGFCDDAEARASYFQATFTCGEAAASGLPMPWSQSSLRTTIQKTSFTLGARGFDNTFYGTHQFSTGYPAPWNGSGGYTQVLIANCLQESDAAPEILSTRSVYTRNTDGSSTATLIVPFYDAEALFMEGTRYESTTDSAITRTTHTANSGLAVQTSRWVFDYEDPVTGTHWKWAESYVEYRVGGPGAVITTENPPDELSTTVQDVSRLLVTRVGSAQALMEDLGSYHDNSLDDATVNYGALSGAGTSVMLSVARHVQVGVGGDIPSFHALVGWV